ncbi:MAG: type II RES/Xre toxin-antitoxin system antitoxin [Terriglobia bacterium]
MNETHTETAGQSRPDFEPRISRFRTRGASLGLKAAQADELIREVERGLSYKALESLAAQSGVAVSVIASVVGIPGRTLARRKTAGKLAPDESERLLRLSTIFEKAVRLFEGAVPAAVTWLTTGKKALGNQTPLAYSRTEIGAREVENLIGRLEHGVFS